MFIILRLLCFGIYCAYCISGIRKNHILFSAGVVAHLASDGAKAWTIETPERNMVLGRMVRAINRYRGNYAFIYLSVCMSVCLSLSLSLSLYLSIYLSIYSLYLSPCLSLSLSKPNQNGYSTLADDKLKNLILHINTSPYPLPFPITLYSGKGKKSDVFDD